MRRLATVTVLATVLFTSPVLAQQEQGDIELQFAGSIFSSVGDEDVSFTSGNFQSKVGYFFTDRLEIGGYPSLTISKFGSDAEVDATFGLGAFVIYSFLAGGATTVPYLGAQYFKSDLSNSDDQGSAGVNGGIKFFINRKTAFDVSGNYLFSLEDTSSGFILVQVGLSFLL